MQFSDWSLFISCVGPYENCNLINMDMVFHINGTLVLLLCKFMIWSSKWMESLFCYTVLEKWTSWKRSKRDFFRLKNSRFKVQYMDFETPKFRPKTPSGSGLTSAPNRGTQQGFSRFYRLRWKSERVENEANAIVFDWKIADLKFRIWTSKPPNFVQKLPREVG